MMVRDSYFLKLSKNDAMITIGIKTKCCLTQSEQGSIFKWQALADLKFEK
ncbi:MAG: hypothetical protein H6Q69_3606 [Firmicutes bacterium]|nr:hypothetical protein [Bacillota bacterium]